MTSFVSRYLGNDNEDIRTVLDFGSQDVNGSYRKLFPGDKWKYLGLDLEAGVNVDLVPQDLYNWEEIASDSIDVVISGQALEHTEFFWLVFEQFERVLKPQGLCCVIAPSSGPEHRYPQDCWRFYPDGMRALCKHSGLNCIEAITEWEPKGYQDGSELWRDTILIARKEKS